MTKWSLTSPLFASALFWPSETNKQQDASKYLCAHTHVNALFGFKVFMSVHVCLCMCHLTRVAPAVSVEYKRYNGTNQKSQAHRNNDDHRGICKQQRQTYHCACGHTVYFTTTGPPNKMKKTVSFCEHIQLWVRVRERQHIHFFQLWKKKQFCPSLKTQHVSPLFTETALCGNSSTNGNNTYFDDITPSTFTHSTMFCIFSWLHFLVATLYNNKCLFNQF